MATDERVSADAPLTRLRSALAGPQGYERVDALLSADDPAAAVGALSVPDLYLLVRQVGFADAQDLLALASPTQLRGCIDLDIWDRDGLALPKLEPWLTALVEAGFERLGEVWARLDPELTALYLARHTVIYDLSQDEEPDDSDDRPVVLTPDTFFALKLLDDRHDSAQLVHRIIDDLYRADLALARHTILSAKTEPLAYLEEMSYRWRSGRMADLGYVEYHEALEVFRPLDPSHVRIGEGSEDRFGDIVEGDEVLSPRNMPAPVAEHAMGRSFLARALDRVTELEHAERLEMALMVLVNKVLAAARVSPGDEEVLRLGADHATATLALGLETVSRGDVDRAAEALRTVSLTRLHRAGYTVTMRLGRLARALAPRSTTAGSPADAVLAALTRLRPFFARELEVPPGEGPRPIESLADVRCIAAELTRLALRIAVAEALGIDLLAMAEKPEPRPELDDHARTALARALAGGEATSAPLSTADIAGLRSRAFLGKQLSTAARDSASRALLLALDRANVVAGRELLPPLMERWLDDLESSFAALPPGTDPDPRFFTGVLLDRALS